MNIVVVDYGVGNICSILNMLKRIGCVAQFSSEPAVIASADKLILPGVGAFDHGMRSLQETGLLSILHEEVRHKKKPVLGICLGMQLLLQGSEEGTLQGLGWIDGFCHKFKFDVTSPLKVPHMGWNVVNIEQPSILFPVRSQEESRFYFVHSYYAQCQHREHVLATTAHGKVFPSVIGVENIFGVQFHPEKSHQFGMQLLKHFAEWNGVC